MTSELSSCTECGALSDELIVKEPVAHLSDQWFVQCSVCGAEGGIANTKEEMIESWNKEGATWK